MEVLKQILATMLTARFMLFMVGAAFVSHLNCVADREYHGKDWTKTPSKCNHCGKRLSVWEKIPVFSCVFLGGRCSKCGARFGYYHAISEFFGGVFMLTLFTKVSSVINIFIILMMAFCIYYFTAYTLISYNDIKRKNNIKIK